MPKKLQVGDPARGLYKRGEVWWLYYRTKGQKIRVSMDTTDKREAIRKAGPRRGRPSESYAANPLFKLAQDYVKSEEAASNFTRSTASSTLYAIKATIQRLGAVSTQDVTPSSSQALYDLYQDRSEATARTLSMRFHAFAKWLFARDYLAEEPARVEFSKRRPVARRTDHFSFDEARQIIAAVSEEQGDLKFVFFAGFFAGMRKNEIINFRPGWLDLGRGVIQIPAFEEVQTKKRKRVWKTKSKLARSIPLHKEFRAFLGEYKWTPQDLYMLHPNRDSKTYRWDPRRPFEEHVAAFRKAHKVIMGTRRLSMHTMRHSFISELANSGKFSATQISMWSGDQVRTIESNYMHPSIKGGELDAL